MPKFIRKISLRLANDSFERHTTWLEIFFDLTLAVIVVQLSDSLFKDLTPTGVLKCAALFLPSMWTWVSYTIFAARFDNNDGFHWLMTFVIMFASIIMAIQIPAALTINGANGFAIGFLISQLCVLLLYAKTHLEQSAPRSITTLYLIGFGLGTLCWFISLFAHGQIKFIFWSLGMLIYLVSPWLGRKKILSQAPLDPVYIPERFGAFTIIILGQLLAATVYGLEFANWHLLSLMTSTIAFILAIFIFAYYYRFIRTANYKCTLGSGQPYIYIHIPLIFSLIIISACVEVFIMQLLQTQKTIYVLFCFSILLYVCSFYVMKKIAQEKLN
ncbi:MAG: low temperature requirement protein A [Legionellales bacterium]|jgi:low temperature requirement protein LtrA